MKDVFSILGVNVDDPAAVEEFRKDLRLAGAMRRAADKGFVYLVMASVGLVFAALVAGVKIKMGSG